MLTPISTARHRSGNCYQHNQAATVLNHFAEIFLIKEIWLSTATRQSTVPTEPCTQF